ncbi:MAG: DUF3775 domain-containing protein [Rhodospirillales bacterium]|nr:DUF3775 domain-containing protein [Rhodospirillales bacterium]
MRIAVEKVCRIIDAVRKVPTVAEDHVPDRQGLAALLTSLSLEEQSEFLALLWLGRGDITAPEWDDACERAQERLNAGYALTALLSHPMLAEELLSGVDQLDE